MHFQRGSKGSIFCVARMGPLIMLAVLLPDYLYL